MSAEAVRRRRPRRAAAWSPWAMVVVLVVAVIAIAGGGGDGGSAKPPASAAAGLVPADALVYVHLSTDTSRTPDARRGEGRVVVPALEVACATGSSRACRRPAATSPPRR